MILGMGSNKRLVAITGFKRGGASYTHSHLEDRMTKKELLKKGGGWWDNYHTRLNDYDGIQVIFPAERKENDESVM